MKKTFIIFTIILVGLSNICTAQNIPQPGDNILNPGLDKFTGHWVFIDGTDTVKVFLKRENVLFPVYNYRSDILIGFHLYKQGNNILESSYDNINTNYSTKLYTIFVGNTDGGSTVAGTLKDLSKNKLLSLNLTINGTHNQIIWELEGLGSYTGPHRPGFTLPKNLTLLKQ